MTGFLHELVVNHADVTVVGKAGTKHLLGRQFPDVNWVVIDAPWTAFYGKYRIWKWPWLRLLGLIRSLRRSRFDVAASVRRDPRDHLVMFLSGAKRRIGIPRGASQVILTKSLTYCPDEHRVEGWSRIAAQVFNTGHRILAPIFPNVPREVPPSSTRILIHVGARIPTRRWPLRYWSELIAEIRRLTSAPIDLILEPDGFGGELGVLADRVHSDLSLEQLVAVTAGASVFLCNDSGPSHIAAALGVPVFAIFGPTKPEWFRPYGKSHHVAIRDICDYRPCFDYCKFPEPYCLTKLTPEMILPELRQFLLKNGIALSPD